MKSFKMNNAVRLGSFILIAILLICIVGVAANGWQADDDANGNINGDQNSIVTNENQKPNNTDDETNTTNKDNDITDPPKYVSTATGLEISEEKFNSPTIGVVFNPLEQLYGLSFSELSIEFPTENGASRILSYTTDNSNLWKLGSLSATRGYISAMCNFYGGIVVSTHNDDIIEYNDQLTINTQLNLFSYDESYYIENGTRIYTNIDMINASLNKSDVTKDATYNTMPFNFCDIGETSSGAIDAKAVIIPFSKINETALYYSSETKNYVYYKSGSKKIDMLNGKDVEYKNVFILFADSTTYEKAEGSELVIDVFGGGCGYYISEGKITEFKWSVNEGGEMIFSMLNGERLTVNRGNSYMAYYKSTESQKIIYS